MNNHEVFKSYYSREEAEATSDLLLQHGIDNMVQEVKPYFDKIYTGGSPDPKFQVLMSTTDFKKANTVIDEYILQHLPAISDDHYLYSFSDAELKDIVRKSDEWSNQDVLLAKKILADKGVNLEANELDELHTTRIKELAQPEKEAHSYILLGYVFAVTFFGGIFFGLLLLTGKKTLPDGTRVPVYTQKTRDHGLAITIISALVLISFFVRFVFI